VRVQFGKVKKARRHDERGRCFASNRSIDMLEYRKHHTVPPYRRIAGFLLKRERLRQELAKI
jgi:hypothetical protein